MNRCLQQFCRLLPLLLVCTAVTADDDIGRLFSTPTDRAELDMLRGGYGSDEKVDVETQQPALQPVSDPLYLNGLIQRSDGRTTVWVNGQRLDQQGGDEMLTLRSRADSQNRVKLLLKDEQRDIRLKPGQAWDPASKQIIERYRVEKRRPQPEQVVNVMGESADQTPVTDGP